MTYCQMPLKNEFDLSNKKIKNSKCKTYFEQHYYNLFRRAFFYFSDYNKNKMQI